jgi:LysR family glycine cleavage system transcriptional activator
MPRPVPLGALRVFEAAARCGSFKSAAAELSVTPGAVSRQIAALEAHLNARLFERRNREVRLTHAGEAYIEEIRPALARIQAASEKFAKPGVRRVVRLDVTPTFALHWLIPRLPDFHARHPGIDVNLNTSMGPIKRTREFDWIVRRDPAHFQGLKGERFLTERSRLVASPAMTGTGRLKRFEDIEDLAEQRLIVIKARPDLWPSWFAAQGLASDRRANRLELDQTIFAIQAAMEGLGVAVLPEMFIAGLLKTGSLVCPMNEQPVTTGAYRLITLKAHASAPAATFRDWIRAAGDGEPGSGDSDRRAYGLKVPT